MLTLEEREPMPRTVQQICYEDDPRDSSHTKRIKKSLSASDDGKFWMQSLSGTLNAEFVGDQELMNLDLMTMNDEYKTLALYIDKQMQEAEITGSKKRKYLLHLA